MGTADLDDKFSDMIQILRDDLRDDSPRDDSKSLESVDQMVIFAT